MVQQHKENFASWDNITEFTDVGDSQVVTDSDPCFWDDALPAINRTAGVRTSTLPAVFSGSDELVLYGRMKGLFGVDAGVGIWLYDGVTYVGMHPIFTLSGFFNGVAGTAGANKIANDTSDDTEKSYWTFNEWFWMRIVINGTSVKFYYLDSNSTVKPNDDDWLEATLIEITLGGALGTITQIGGVFTEVTGNLSDSRIDDIEIVVGEGIPIANSVIDGDTVKISSLYTRNTLGQIGANCRLTYHDPTHALASTIEPAHRTVITASETKWNTRLFQGEVVHTDTTTREIIAAGIQEKLRRKIANHDPVYTRGVVEYIDGNTMYKQNIGYETSPVFSDFGTLTDKLIVFIKKRTKEYRCGIASVAYTDDGDGAQAPTATSGSIANTFFLVDKAFSDSTRAYNFDIRAPHDRIAITYEAIILDTSVINKATLNLKIRLPRKQALRNGHTPQLMIYDYTNSQFRNLPSSVKGLGDDGAIRLTSGSGRNDYGSSTGNTNVQTKVLEIVISLPDDIPQGVIADYSSVGAANAHGFKQHDYKIAISTGHTGVATAIQFVTIEQSELRFDLDIDQSYSIGVSKIQTVNDHNLVFYANAAISWLDADIRDDGISGGGIDEEGMAIGDEYYITDKLSDIAAAIWSASGIDLILNLNFTVTDEIPDIEDASRVMILDWLQKMSELVGGAYWIDYTTDPVNDLPTLTLTDTFTDSGLILTDADFIEPMRQTTYKIDSSDELSTLRLMFSDGKVGTVSITPEHNPPDLGLETEFVPRPDIHTSRQAAQWLSKKKLLYTNAHRYFTCRINYDRANQDYSVLTLGKEVQVKNPTDASIVDHLTGTNGRLLVYQIELNRNWANGYTNYVNLILQLRS